MSGKSKSRSVMGEVLKYVLQYGPCSCLEIRSHVKGITAQQAIRIGKRSVLEGHRRVKTKPKRSLTSYSVGELVRIGKISIVNGALKRLRKCGKLFRVSKGVYGPPPARPILSIYKPKTA